MKRYRVSPTGNLNRKLWPVFGNWLEKGKNHEMYQMASVDPSNRPVSIIPFSKDTVCMSSPVVFVTGV